MSGGALRYHLELRVRQAFDQVMRELSAGSYVKRDALASKATDELVDTSGDLGGVDDVLRMHVRRGHDYCRPVGHGCRGQREAVLDPRRPVIDPGKEMEVELNVTQSTLMIDVVCRDFVIIL
jgi:hypothetical protein